MKSSTKKVPRTVYLPEPLNQQLADEAARRGFSGNDLVIMALQAYLGKQPPALPAPLVPSVSTTPDEDMADF